MAKVRFESLVNAAAKVSGKQDITPRDAAEYFLSVGTDYKGQNQSCYSAFGAKLSTELSIDPLKLHTAGVFSSEITIASKVEGLHKALLVCQIGPKNTLTQPATPSSMGRNLTVIAPKMLNFCSGMQYRGEIEARLFVGLSFNTNTSIAGANANLEISGKARGAISGDYFYAENIIPLPFSQNSDLRRTLPILLSVDSFKEFLKQPAVDLINDKNWAEKKLELKKNTTLYSYLRGSNIETSALVQYIDKGLQSEGNPEIKKQAEIIRRNLTTYKENTVPSIVTSIRIFTGEVQGEAKATVEASLTAEAMGYQGGVTTSNVIGNTSASYRPVYVRFQTAYPAKDTSSNPMFVVMTQDTTICYRSWSFQLLNSTNNANIGTLINKTKNIESKVYGERQMSYVTTTVYWASKDKIHPYWEGSGAADSSARPKEVASYSLAGTGISFGASFLLSDLKEALEWNYSPLEELDLEEILAAPQLVNTSEEPYEVRRVRVSQAINAFDDWLKRTNELKALKALFAPHKEPPCVPGLRTIVDGGQADELEQAIAWLLGKDSLNQDASQTIATKLKKRLIDPASATLHLSATTPRANSATNQLAYRLATAWTTSREEIIASKVQMGNTHLQQQQEYTAKKLVITEENKRRAFLNQEIREINEGLFEFMAPKTEYMQKVAEQLKVTLEQLYELFEDEKVKKMILEYETAFGVDEDAAIILESGFLCRDPQRITLTSTLLTKKEGGRASAVMGERIELKANTEKKLINTFNSSQSNISLNVIRIRFRVQSKSTKETTLFNTGSFKVLGNGGKIELKSVSEAGSEGIVDVAVKWYGATVQPLDDVVNYESGVPPVALYCQ